MDRFLVLRNLVTFGKSIDELSDMLSQLSWDYENQPFVVKSSEVKIVLERFLSGERSAKELEDWANLIECREDLEFEEQGFEAIENIIDCLANPVLQGKITTASCEALLASLDVD